MTATDTEPSRTEVPAHFNIVDAKGGQYRLHFRFAGNSELGMWTETYRAKDTAAAVYQALVEAFSDGGAPPPLFDRTVECTYGNGHDFVRVSDGLLGCQHCGATVDDVDEATR